MDDSWSTIALEASCLSISRRNARRRRAAHTPIRMSMSQPKKRGLGEKRDLRELEHAQVELISKAHRSKTWMATDDIDSIIGKFRVARENQGPLKEAGMFTTKSGQVEGHEVCIHSHRASHSVCFRLFWHGVLHGGF